jgi:hypothetical protein
MITEHWVWFALAITCIVWYSTITFYVTIKGYTDIKGMLKKLKDDQ